MTVKQKITDWELKELKRLFQIVEMKDWTSEDDSTVMATLSGYLSRLRNKYNLELDQVIDVNNGEIKIIGS